MRPLAANRVTSRRAAKRSTCGSSGGTTAAARLTCIAPCDSNDHQTKKEMKENGHRHSIFGVDPPRCGMGVVASDWAQRPEHRDHGRTVLVLRDAHDRPGDARR